MQKQKEVRRIVKTHERLGDDAYAQRFYEDAVRHFEKALSTPSIENRDRLQLAEKLSAVLFFSGDPERANVFFEQLIKEYLKTGGTEEKALKILLRMAPQRWLDCNTKAALPVIAQALRIAEARNAPFWQKRAHILMAGYHHALNRHADARMSIDAAGNVESHEFASLRPLYYDHRAMCAAVSGDVQSAFKDFERAIEVAKEQSVAGYRLTTIWDDYGLWATSLGEIEVAKACHERALFVAHQHQIYWRIPYLCLRYADLLARMGQLDIAQEYINDALRYDTLTPRVALLLASVGIPAMLALQDDHMVGRCTWLPAIDLAFQTGEGAVTARISAAFAQLFIAQGRQPDAQALLHRALGTVSFVDQCWELPIEVARSGASSDISAARELLERRVSLPAPQVAQACLSLFDALVDSRRGKFSASRRAAADAMTRFGALRWHAYAHLSRSLLRTDRGSFAKPALTGNRLEDGQPFADMVPALTLREQQVAKLALKGQTNREIAGELSISENTVETHMASIMTRLGIRSRHQLVDFFN